MRILSRVFPLAGLVVATVAFVSGAGNYRHLRMQVLDKATGLTARVYEVQWFVGATVYPSGGHSASSNCGGNSENAYDGDKWNTYW